MSGPPAPDRSPQALGAGALRTMAFSVIVIAGLKAAAPIILPVLAAALVALACLPLTRRLERFGLPRVAAILTVMMVVAISLVGVAAVVAGSVRSFLGSLAMYQERVWEIVASFRVWLERHQLDLPDSVWSAPGSTARFSDVARLAAESLLNLLSGTSLVLFVTFFILLEAHTFGAKLQAAYGTESGLDLISDQVHRYLNTKAAMSFLTAVLAGAINLALGVDFPLVWALLAFLFNFVPTVGSIIAAVPPISLALLEFGVGRALVVTAGYLIVNLGISSLEPRIMGERLGLSPLVVILSLVFWAWVWGSLGMILALPLTMIVKILFESSSDLRPIGILLGPPIRRQ